jgi:cytochrome P450
MPFLDLLFEKNPLVLFLQRIGFNRSVFPVTKFAQEQSNKRAGEMTQIKENGLNSLQKAAQGKPNRGVDLLSKFTQAQRDHPDFMNDQKVLTSCVSMVFAGSETTAISLSAVFFYLLQSPTAYKKLMAELDTAVQNGDIDFKEGEGLVSWAVSQKLPYLDAVIQETFRLHPAAGLLLERVVPPQGAVIAGEQIPGGTIVGCNAWVVHRRPEVFGEDANAYRPERWLEAGPSQLTKMKSTMFQFGAGARTCLGKNVSLLEMYKLVPSFLLRYEVSVCSSSALF